MTKANGEPPSARSLTKDLPEDAIAEVLAASVVKELATQQVVFRQDETAEALYLVESGRLKLTQLTASGQTITVRLVGAGELCAAIAVLDGKAYPFTAAAAEPSRVRLWMRDRLRDLFRRHPRLEANLLEIVGAHTREMMDRFRELATEPVAQRIARALLRLVEAGGHTTTDGIGIERVTQQDVAELAATTLYTVNRVLADWQGDGLLSRHRGRIVIHDEPRLRGLAEA